jgi:hypothetical protein
MHPDVSCGNSTHHTSNNPPNVSLGLDEMRYGFADTGCGFVAAAGDMEYGESLRSSDPLHFLPLSVWQICVILLFIAQTGFFNSTQ